MEQENNNLLNLFSKFATLFNKPEQNSKPQPPPQTAKPKLNDKAVIDFIRLHDSRKKEILDKLKQ